MKEYAFDVKLYAVVRIKALTRKKAEAALSSGLDCADLNVTIDSRHGSVTLTEASIYVDDVEYPFLFEVDGIPVDDH